MKLSDKGYNFAKKVIELYKEEDDKTNSSTKISTDTKVDPTRIIGTTDYKKFENMSKEIDLEDMKKNPKTAEALKMGCNNDLRKERQLMDKPAKDKQEAALLFKTEGDDYLKEKNYELAINSYEKGLLQLFYTFSDDPEEDKKTDEIKVSINLNLSMAKMKINKFEEAMGYCQEVLRLNKTHMKALYRVGYCYFKMDKMEEAKKYVKDGLEIQSDSPEFLSLKDDIAKREKLAEDESRKLFKKILK